MTIGKTIAATPDFIQQKPNTIVQGAGMLGGLVYGIDEEGEWYFNGSGKRPEELKKKRSRLAPTTPPRRQTRARAAR